MEHNNEISGEVDEISGGHVECAKTKDFLYALRGIGVRLSKSYTV